MLAPHLISEDARQRERAAAELLALGPAAAGALTEMTKTAAPSQVEAIRSLLPRYGPAAIAPMFTAARSDYSTEWKANVSARKAIAAMGDDARPWLREALEGDDPDARSFAVGVLSLLGPRAVDDLNRLLKHPDQKTRISASRILAKWAEPRSADGLLEALESDDSSLRATAAMGLGAMRHRAAVDALLRHLHDADAQVREAVVGALGQMYEPRFRKPFVHLVRFDPSVAVRDTTANFLIGWTGDRVAQRLGWRYKPVSRTPQVGWVLPTTRTVLLSFTGFLMFLVLWVCGRNEAVPPWRLGAGRGAWVAAGVLAGFGFLWGGLMPRQTVTTERLILGVCAPTIAAIAWLVGPQLAVFRAYLAGLVAAVLATILSSLWGLYGFAWALVLAPWALWLSIALVLVEAVRYWRKRVEPVGAGFRRVTTGGIAGFYAGYGLGWLWLWGYLGV